MRNSGNSDNFGCIFSIVAILAIIAGLGVFGAGGCGQSYSDGDRSGVVVKLSRKGFIWKSWEGEMRLGGDQNVTSGAWAFSIRNESLVGPLQESLKSGHRVTVHYTQWWHKPIEMESNYEALTVTSQPDNKETSKP